MAVLGKKTLIEQTAKIIKTSAVLFLGLAVLAILLMDDSSSKLVLDYSTTDGLSTSSNSKLGKAETTVIDIQYRYALAAVLIFSSALLIALSTRWKESYAKTVKAKVSGFRWVYLGLTYAPILAITALLFGINSFNSLLIVEMLVVIYVLFAWLTERESVQSKRPRWFGYSASVAAGLLALSLIVLAAIGTALYGNTNYDWHVYLAGLIAIKTLVDFSVIQKLSLKAKKSWRNYEFGERNYFAVDLALKAAFAVTLIVAFYR